MFPKQLLSMPLAQPVSPSSEEHKAKRGLPVLQGLQWIDTMERARELQVPEYPRVRLFWLSWGQMGRGCWVFQAALRKPKWKCVQMAVPRYDARNPHIINSTNPTPKYHPVKAAQLT